MAVGNVSQSEIAEHLHLSQSTVARVLNRNPHCRIAPETRIAVLEAARTLGYRSRVRRTGNISFLVCGAAHKGSYDLYRYIIAEASRVHYRIFMESKASMPSYKEINLTINPLSADGVIVHGAISSKTIRQLSEVMPVTYIGLLDEPGNADSVWSDDADLIGQILRYLASLGHRNIGILVHSRKMQGNLLERSQVELEALGLTFDQSMVWEKEKHLISDLAQSIVSHEPRPTALLAHTASDHPAIIYSLLALGCRIPEDLSYFGWECVPESSLSNFEPLTSLDGYHAAHARAAVQRLVARIEDRDLPPEKILVRPNIREGMTCRALD